MGVFLDWFETDTGIDPVLKAAQAHLWFVTIHPFEDGNGRIARAIADRALARSENSPQRFYSLSTQIWQERKAYYDILEQTQKGTMDITPWMSWFLGCLGRAIDSAQSTLGSVLAKARFWERARDIALMTPAPRPEPPARRLRGQAHDVQVREDRQVLPGHRPPGHPAVGGERDPRAQSGRGAQHQLFSRAGVKRHLIRPAPPAALHTSTLRPDSSVS